MKFYSYLWLSPEGTPYYVGKGTGDRAFEQHERKGKCCILRPKPRSHILIFPQKNEAAAYESEIVLIQTFGRTCDGTGTLLNVSLGGRGGPSVQSADTKRKIGLANTRSADCRKRWAYKNNIATKVRAIWAMRKKGVENERVEM